MFNADTCLLSISYCGPIQYFSKFYAYQNIFIERHENYQKQTYRNRCYILSANGILPLIIPIIHTKSKIGIVDVKIDNQLRWKTNHLRAIEAAYRSSPFFMYYYPDLENIFKKDCKFLFDFNYKLIEYILEILEINMAIKFTSKFKSINNFVDYVNCIQPKKKNQIADPLFKNIVYYQVFQYKFSFVPNLSILDLIFNTGPEASEYLKLTINLDHLNSEQNNKT